MDDSGKQLLERIRLGAQRMASLIDDLLELSRITRAEIQRQPVDLSQMAISDFSLPGFSGISALKMVREKDPKVRKNLNCSARWSPAV